MTQNIGQIIRKLRKEQNFTQEELAEQLNISAQAPRPRGQRLYHFYGNPSRTLRAVSAGG